MTGQRTPDGLDPEVSDLAQSHSLPYRTPTGAFDQCWDASLALAAEMTAAGHRCCVYRVVGDRNASAGGDPRWDPIEHTHRHHYVVGVEDRIVDLTARQFDSGQDCPLVYPSSELTEHWEGVEELDEDQWRTSRTVGKA